MKQTYDSEIDAAYIGLAEIKSGEVDATYMCENLPENISAEMINLDFDKQGRLLGIEIVGARKVLPADLLG